MEMILVALFGMYELKGTPGFNEHIVFSGYILALTWIIAPFLFNPFNLTNDDHTEDYREWKHWLYSSGDENWEAWWEKEISRIQTFQGKAIETILSLRFFIIQYVVYQKMDVFGAKTYFMDYIFFWGLAVVLLVLYEVIKTFPAGSLVNVQQLSKSCLRMVKTRQFIIVTGSWVIVSTQDILGQIVGFIFAFIPTGWGIISICVVLKPVMKMIGLWKLVISLARFYEVTIGTLVYVIGTLVYAIMTGIKVFLVALNLAELEELNSRTAKAVALAKESKVKLARLDDGVNANVDDQANPSNFATIEKEEEVQGAAPKSDDAESFYQAKLVTQDESSSIDSQRENAPRVIADSEKAKKMEELISTIAKAMVLAKELEMMAQVPKEKEEHASLIEQVGVSEQKVEDY